MSHEGLASGRPPLPHCCLCWEHLNALFRLAEMKEALGALGASRIQECIFLYADDVILFASPREKDLVATATILEIFAQASGIQFDEIPIGLLAGFSNPVLGYPPICQKTEEV